jgi:LuxR family maltose regulon positive regulatory protein
MVDRPRLATALDTALGLPLTLVSAPAGFGKTSLGAAYLAELQARPVSMAGCLVADLDFPVGLAWLSLDEEDDDPVRFWDLVVAALGNAEVVNPAGTLAPPRTSSPTGMEAGFAGIAESVRSMHPPSANELSSAILNLVAAQAGSFILVIDDFHLVSSPLVLESFGRFVERLPEKLRLILLSRVDPPLPLARFRARGTIAELRTDDLRFLPDEADAFLQAVLGGRITNEQVLAIDSKAEGWAAGLQMAALSLTRKTDADAFIRGFSGSDRFVLEFLMEEVLAAQPDDVREFLLASSCLERFCGELCEAVALPSCDPQEAGPGCGREMIRRLEASNLFIVPLDDEGIWFRYHHLFGETLRARSRCSTDARGREILYRAAAWHELKGADEAAVSFYLRAGDKEKAADVLDRIAYNILAKGGRSALEARMAEVGEPIALRRPELAEVAGWAQTFSGNPVGTEAFLDRLEAAAEGMPTPKAASDLRGAVLAMRAFVFMKRGMLEESIACAANARDFLSPGRFFARSIVPFIYGTYWRMKGNYPQAMISFIEFHDLSWTWGEIWNMMMASFELCVTARYMGRLNEASEYYQKAMAEVARRGITGFGSDCKVYGNYAEILYERNQLAEVETLLAAYMDGGEDWILPSDVLAAMSPIIKTRLARGNLEEAGELLQRAAVIESNYRIFPRLTVMYRDLRARLSIVSGNPLSPPDLPVQFDQALVAVCQAVEATDIRLLVAGSPAGTAGRTEAARRAASLAQAARENGGLALFIEAKVLEALALWPDEQEAFAALVEALRPGMAEGFIRTFADAGPGISTLLQGFIGWPKSEPDLRSWAAVILKACGGPTPSSPASGPASSKYEISPREMEVLQVLAEGCSNREIADRLFISEGTVKTHLHHLTEKFEVTSRLAIVAKAREAGLV